MRLAYADPPYPGRAHLYEEHVDYAGEVDHVELVKTLVGYDGWALSTSSAALREVLGLCPDGVRVVVWVKNTVRYAWEPVIVWSARVPQSVRDWIHCEPDAYQWRPKPSSYVIGRKPEPFCRWVFEWLGAEPDDELDDLFPGSGAVTDAWRAFTSQTRLTVAEVPNKRATRRAKAKALAAQPMLGSVVCICGHEDLSHGPADDPDGMRCRWCKCERFISDSPLEVASA